MNMAPVLDVLPQAGPSIMADRCFGADPSWVGRMGCAVVDGLQQGRVMAVGKHFPGIGRTLLDSHLDLPEADFTLAQLRDLDLIPYAAAIARGVSGIMLSHILYRRIDARFPASLSIALARDLLRRAMGFGGLVLTDDLDMGAIKGRYDLETIANQILAAQVDIALICHSRPDMEKMHDCFCRRMAADGSLGQEALGSVERIMALKRRYLGQSA
jgi:beta-N-acetylhexosaminidase